VVWLALAPPAAAWYELTAAETTLAYRVRVVRGEDTYRLRQWLIDVAGVRAMELRKSFSHYCSGVPCADRLIPNRCSWGEILAWTSWGTARDATAWAIQAWLDSPSHRGVLLGSWQAYGVGIVSRSGGGWYMAVVFVNC
jgi:hypothetical protein